jgi:hypothetical protein
MQHNFKRGDKVRLIMAGQPIGKVLNISTDALNNPIASVHWLDNGRVEVMSLSWLKRLL